MFYEDKKISWLLDNSVFREECKDLKDAIIRNGMDFEECVITNNMPEWWLLDFDINFSIFRGSIQHAKYLRKYTTDKFILSNFEKLKCSYYYPIFGSQILNNDYILMSVGSIIQSKSLIQKTFGDYVFIRPNEGDKSFNGEVFNLDDIKDLYFKGIPSNTIALISSQKPVYREWRCVIHRKEVVTSSAYNGNNKPPRSDVVPYVEGVLNRIDYNPDLLYTLDVCETTNNELKILEANSFSCAGLYDCDYDKVVLKIKELYTD